MNEERERQFNILVGVRKAGKSTFLAEKVVKPYSGGNIIVVKHLVNRYDPALIFLPEKTPSNWRQGAAPGTPVKCRFIVNSRAEYREILRWVIDNYKNGALIIDDGTILEKIVLTPEMELLVTMCRHMGIDLWIVYHGLTKLPIEQFIFVDHFIFFNTTDKIDRKKESIPDFEVFENAIMQARANYRSTDVKTKYTPVILKMT